VVPLLYVSRLNLCGEQQQVQARTAAQ
jgi:hypothetical protein